MLMRTLAASNEFNMPLRVPSTFLWVSPLMRMPGQQTGHPHLYLGNWPSPFSALHGDRSAKADQITATEQMTKRVFTQSGRMERDCVKPAGIGWIAATQGSDKAGFYAIRPHGEGLRETSGIGWIAATGGATKRVFTQSAL